MERRKAYASDISREQFESVRPVLESERKLNTSLQMVHLAFLRLLLKRS
jgi:hypothetical protein